MSELKNCPFCGSMSIVLNCGSPLCLDCYTTAVTVKKWNTRHLDKDVQAVIDAARIWADETLRLVDIKYFGTEVGNLYKAIRKLDEKNSES